MKFVWKKLGRTIYCCLQLVRLKWKDNKCLFFMDVSIGLLREARLLLEMVFPAVVIQLILDASCIDRALLAVFGVSCLLTAAAIGIEVLQRLLSDHSLRALNYLILGLNRSAMDLDLEQFERGENLDRFDRAYDGIWESSDVDFLLFSVILSKLLSFGVTVYIFSTVHWLVSVFTVLTLMMEFLWSARTDEKLHQKDIRLSGIKRKASYVADTVLNSRAGKDIFLNNAGSFFQEKYREASQEALEIGNEKRRDTFSLERRLAGIGLVRTAGIYGAGVWQYTAGGLPLANFTLFANAAKQMAYAIWQIMQGVQGLLRASGYFEDYIQYLELGKEDIQQEAAMPEREAWEIEFWNVCYQYPGQDHYALKDLTFKITRGQAIALVGDNGAGKSTVVKLLLRLYRATEGDILLNGRSIYSYEKERYLSHLAPVFQDFMMYAFSIRENLVFGGEKEERELFRLLDEAGIGERVRALPRGLDTPYTKQFYQDGVEFSGGEEQKLAIARALAREGELLVLDEPTAAIDPLAEAEIYRLVSGLRESHTTLFVSHRMSSTRFCDRILVLDQGELREEGTHGELMGQKGLYYEMYTMQMQNYEKGGTDEQDCCD